MRGMFSILEARCAREEHELATWSAAAHRAATGHPDARGRLTGVALRALAHRAAGRSAQADRDFELVLAALEREPGTALGFPTYYAAYDAWQRGALDDAETLANRPTTPEVAPFAAALLGLCAFGRGRYAKATAAFAETLRLLRSSETPNRQLYASTLHETSRIVVETVDLRNARRLKREVAEFTWPTSLARLRLATLGNMRLIALLEGDVEGAWMLSRDAVACAVDPAESVLAETDAAVASRLLGDERATHLQLRRAWDTLRQQRWPVGDPGARYALASFAREAASDMPGEARKAIATFDALTPRHLRESAEIDERRVRACGAMAHGRIAEVRGRYDAAYDRYRESFDIWRDLRHDLRAAIVAVDLQRLARDPLFEEQLDAVLERAPEAWFAPQASPASELLGRLTPAETLVLGALLGGKSARAIAADLDRSVHTINNHTRKIFAAFGVTSRAAVLARCAELGVTVKSLERIV